MGIVFIALIAILIIWFSAGQAIECSWNAWIEYFFLKISKWRSIEATYRSIACLGTLSSFFFRSLARNSVNK